MSNDVKTKAKAFIKKYKFNKPTLAKLYSVIESQGYMLIEFNGIDDEKNVENVIRGLNLTEYAKYTKAFTYANESLRLVFVHEDLSDDEKLAVLLHEEGHIFCGHIKNGCILGEDVLQENEANEFVHYVTNQSFLSKIGGKKIPIICSAALLAIGAGGVYAGTVIQEENTYYEEYYVSKTGGKYHEEDCRYVKNKTDVRRLTKDDYESGIYEPCKVCILD